jgi:hypothetical protein
MQAEFRVQQAIQGLLNRFVFFFLLRGWKAI